MKKVKWTIMSLAILFSVCAAFVTRPKFDCTQAQQYYFTGNGYALAGVYGVTYVCEAGSTTCTYYTVNGGITYSPCALGSYTICQGCIIKDPAKKEKSSNPSH